VVWGLLFVLLLSGNTQFLEVSHQLHMLQLDFRTDLPSSHALQPVCLLEGDNLFFQLFLLCTLDM